ncbi:MAG: polymer-forming cytoskeletal protein [Nitrospinae bacterium]|nr:polymer-forming cytoskeletal protein [Nitrospinota bacterium]
MDFFSGKKLKALTEEECARIEDKDPAGTYDSETREDLYWIIEKLRQGRKDGTWFERRLYNKFRDASFGLLINRDSETDYSVNFHGNVRVEAHFKGRMRASGTVVVAGTGSVLGDIEAQEVRCQGRVRGAIVASQKVEIASGADVEGEIRTASFHIDRGARFEGRCQMASGRKNPGDKRSPLAAGTRI